MICAEIILLRPGLLDMSGPDAFQSLPRVEGRVVQLFSASLETYDYSHHASLGVQGEFLHAFWSNGRNGEDLPGQVQRWSMRDADGAWSPPSLLAQAPMNPDSHPETTTVINGGTAVGAPRLTSFYSEYKGRVSDGAGGTGKWSLPVVTGVRTYDQMVDRWTHRGIVLEDFLLNEGPRRAASGRWIMTGEDHAGCTRVAYSDAPDPADPAWQVASVPKGEGNRFKNEVSWLQRPDGTLALFMREDGQSRRIWLSESRDDGLTWSTPSPTNLPDATAKCNVGQLSDGSYYCISNPHPGGQRIPLTVALSGDGAIFDRLAVLRDKPTTPRLSGRFKGPGYQYPNAIEHAGQLHVIYSVNKEDVDLLSVDLEELRELPCV